MHRLLRRATSVLPSAPRSCCAHPTTRAQKSFASVYCASSSMSGETTGAAGVGAAAAPDADTIVIDGLSGEGGGQLLRNATTLAGILERNARVHSIRANRRPRGGLKAQHLASVRLVADLCGGYLEGDELGSTEITYHRACGDKKKTADDDRQQRRRRIRRSYVGDTGTAGSICLLLQASFPCALLATTTAEAATTATSAVASSAEKDNFDDDDNRVSFTFKGGTNATLAPQYDYWEQVFLPTLCRQCGVNAKDVEARVLKRGYFPRGGGEVQVRVRPLTEPLLPIQLTDRGQVCAVRIRSFRAGPLVSGSAAQIMADAAQSYLRKRLISATTSSEETPPIRWTTDVVTETSAVGSGAGILIVAETTTGGLLGGSALLDIKTKNKNKGGKKHQKWTTEDDDKQQQKQAVRVGTDAAEELWSALELGGCVDDWLQDQLILYMALADGTSNVMSGSLTLHTRTAIDVAEQLSGAKFEVRRLQTSPDDGGGGVAASVDDSTYGKDGRIPGRHLIKCVGIGYRPDHTDRDWH